MTTIAWDGKTLAGDTLACAGSLRRYVPSKVHKIVIGDQAILFGCSGFDEDMHAMLEWIRNGMDDSRRLTFAADRFTGMLIRKDGLYRLESSTRLLPIMERFHAIGDGRDFAIAAMECGMNARGAVEVACKYNVYSGLPITEVSLYT